MSSGSVLEPFIPPIQGPLEVRVAFFMEALPDSAKIAPPPGGRGGSSGGGGGSRGGGGDGSGRGGSRRPFAVSLNPGFFISRGDRGSASSSSDPGGGGNRVRDLAAAVSTEGTGDSPDERWNLNATLRCEHV